MVAFMHRPIKRLATVNACRRKETNSAVGGPGGGEVDGVRAEAALSVNDKQHRYQPIHFCRFRTRGLAGDFAGDEVWCGLAVLVRSSSDEIGCLCLACCTGVRVGFVELPASAPVAHGSLRVIPVISGLNAFKCNGTCTMRTARITCRSFSASLFSFRQSFANGLRLIRNHDYGLMSLDRSTNLLERVSYVLSGVQGGMK